MPSILLLLLFDFQLNDYPPRNVYLDSIVYFWLTRRSKIEKSCVDVRVGGRLYYWKTALKVCPAGWHLPSTQEWDTLKNSVGDSSTAGTKLKSTEGWYENGNGTDDFGFSALPGGNGNGGYVGRVGCWWTRTWYNKYLALSRQLGYDYEYVGEYISGNTFKFSVRCVKD